MDLGFFPGPAQTPTPVLGDEPGLCNVEGKVQLGSSATLLSQPCYWPFPECMMSSWSHALTAWIPQELPWQDTCHPLRLTFGAALNFTVSHQHSFFHPSHNLVSPYFLEDCLGLGIELWITQSLPSWNGSMFQKFWGIMRREGDRERDRERANTFIASGWEIFSGIHLQQGGRLCLVCNDCGISYFWYL